jgi:hypothetical protein
MTKQHKISDMTKITNQVKSGVPCEHSSEGECTHPAVQKMESGDHFMISKVISAGTILTILILFVNAVVSWTTMYVNQENTLKAVENNSRLIAESKSEFGGILKELRAEIKESRAEALQSSVKVATRVDRLLELELQSRR